jgi:hypothetical protein
MVQLTKHEQFLVKALERREEFLKGRIAASGDKADNRDRTERTALSWALEIIALAAGMDCEEVFTCTMFRVEDIAEKRQRRLKAGNHKPVVLKLQSEPSPTLERIYKTLHSPAWNA